MEREGIIYILENPSFPGLCKIGFTYNIRNRLAELNSETGVPYAFRVYAIYKTKKTLADKYIHQIIDTLNPDLRTAESFGGKRRLREFYAIGASTAYSILECIAEVSGTRHCLKLTRPDGRILYHPNDIDKDSSDKSEYFRRVPPPEY